jgi:glyoxylase-like metal-dependent hydrolase (beta-lactamase superfamily II)
MLFHRSASIAFVLVAILFAGSAMAQGDFDDVEIQITPIAEGIHVLNGRGGAMAVCTGDDGVFLIDDQFAPLSDKIAAAIATLQEGGVRFVLNTHWHGDHTGGNENFGERGAVLVAQNNVRQRMSTKQFSEFLQRETPPSPLAALPIITFERQLEFHINGEDILALHMPRAHTDGDAIVSFRNANVIHCGDVYFAGMYPYIDLSSGGSIDGTIEAARKILAMADDDTRLIAGHGPVTGRAELQAYHDMLVGLRQAVQSAIDSGADLEATIALKPSAAYDAEWGQGWIQPDQIVTFIYGSLTTE